MPDGVRQIWEDEPELVLVGGAVRDIIWHRAPVDWDFATPLTPDVITERLSRKGYQVIPTGVAYGTVTILDGRGASVEVTTFRRDGPYRKHERRPQGVTFSQNLYEDLARRDYTINALAALSTGDVVDVCHGIDDLFRGILRTVGDPMMRFKEDPLRMWRGYRLAARWEGMILDQSVQDAIVSLQHGTIYLSAERIQGELLRLFGGPYLEGPLRQMWLNTRLLDLIMPEITASKHYDQKTPHHRFPLHEHAILTATHLSPRDPVLRLAGFLHDIGKPFCQTFDRTGTAHYYEHEKVGAFLVKEIAARLRLPHAVGNRMRGLVAEHMFPFEAAGDAAYRRRLVKLGYEALHDLVELHRADVFAAGLGEWNSERARRRIARLSEEWQDYYEDVDGLAITGHDVLAMQRNTAGKWVAEQLEKCRQWVLDDPRRNTREQLLSFLKNELDETGTGDAGRGETT